MRNPPWSRDEHIVALDFYLKHAPSIPDKGSNEITQLSAELNRLHASISDERYDNFRNPNGVYMKLMNFDDSIPHTQELVSPMETRMKRSSGTCMHPNPPYSHL